MENAVIPGADVKDAMKRLRGNAGLYAKLVKRFLDGKELDALKAAVEGGDAAEAANAAHTMKGAAANLSLTDIRQGALDLELLLKSEGLGEKHRDMLSDIERMYESAREGFAPYL